MVKMKFLIALVLLCITSSMYSQDSLSVKLTADIVNRYVFRGQNCGGESAHIQPSLSIGIKNAEVGSWGSEGISNNYNEIDLYAKYNFKKIAIQYIHYATVNDGEIILYYKPFNKIPLLISSATYVYGPSDYSNYSEIAYSIQVYNLPIDLFVGATPYCGVYNQFQHKFNIVNIGGTIRKDILALPTYITLSGNPQSKEVFLVFGLTIK